MSEATVEEYLAVCGQFKLGKLPTECSNPLTERLSFLCQQPETVGDALTALQSVDIAALRILCGQAHLLIPLADAIHQTFLSGKKIVCEGCGATGRLSLSLEVFAKEGMVREEAYRNKVLGFMAGGDAAFIRSIEQFEDRVAFGKRQLHDIGFEDGDLLIAITEGGETPFVIAACEEAVEVSKSNTPYFVYCNPDDVLCEVAQRSANVIQNERIKKINLCVGPMSITGSTRMQATTVQVTAVGLAIQHHSDPSQIEKSLARLLETIEKKISYAQLAPFTREEALMYASGEHFLYETDYFAVTVMTDTTERAPTFSMPPFENFDFPEQLASPVYLVLPGVRGALDGWTRLLRRAPRPLEWDETKHRTGLAAIGGYDFSESVVEKRQAKLGLEKTKLRAVVALNTAQSSITFSIPLRGISIGVVIPDPDVLGDILLSNVVAKVLLNAHSTAVMGILGRFEGNVMIWVRPTNNKLIDRAARYVKLIVERRIQALAAAANDSTTKATPAVPTYEDVCRKIYELREQLPPDQPIVIHAANFFLQQTA